MPCFRSTRVLLILASTLAVALAAPAVSEAMTSAYYQVQIHETYNTFGDGGNLAYLTPRREVVKVGGRKVRVTWGNVSISGSFANAIGFFPDNGAVVGVLDQKLNARQSKTLSSRPLWRDADVLVVAPDNPLCSTGVTRAQAEAVLRGSVTTWNQLTAAWPVEAPQAISLWVPVDSFGDPTVLFGVRTPTAHASHGHEGTDIAYAASAPGVIAAARWSGVRKARATGIAPCVLPIDGVAPTDETVAAQAYPTSFTAYWVWKRKVPAFSAMVRRAYERHLFGARGRAYLGTYLDRDRQLAF